MRLLGRTELAADVSLPEAPDQGALGEVPGVLRLSLGQADAQAQTLQAGARGTGKAPDGILYQGEGFELRGQPHVHREVVNLVLGRVQDVQVGEVEEHRG